MDTNISRFAVILAGGSGTRLWPLSRTSKPKQLLALNGGESLLQETVRRLLPRVAAQNICVVTGEEYRFEVMGQLHAIDPVLADQVLSEPVGRNTLPAIAWATARIARSHPEALVGVFSSDHAVADDAAFLAAWDAAESAAQAGRVGLFGIQPDHPATGYGYIEAGEVLDGTLRAVKRFVEKPDLATAQGWLQQGGFYWNAGMFVFRAADFLGHVARLQPVIHAAAGQLADLLAAPSEIYASLPNVAIDTAILEHLDDTAMVPVDMGWSDLGSWEALYRQNPHDTDGNLLHGDVLALDSQNSLLWSENGLLAAFGVQDLAVVHTHDATLVCPRNQVEDLKRLVSKVRETHPRLTETHLTVNRPWGSFTVLEEGPRYKIKRIVVNPGARLSMQMHYHRSEHWVVISGTARIINGEQEIHLEENQSTYIPQTHRHRLENPGRIPLQIIEIQSGAYLEEDDIVRFDDEYGRTCE